MLQIENRTYESDSTEEEIQMLKDRVQLIDDTTIYFDEVPIMSEFAIQVTTDQIGEYLNISNVKYLIINLLGTDSPNAPIRAKLKECYTLYIDRINYVAFFTGNNIVMNLIAKYMVRSVGYKKFSIHKTKEQAYKAIRDEQNR